MKNVKPIISLVTLLCLHACSDTKQLDKAAEQQENLVASGELISTDSVTISPPTVSSMWQYRIQYLATENSSVKQGDVVVRFDPQTLMEELMSKQSELAAAVKEREQKQLEQEQNKQNLVLALAEAKMNYEKEKRKAEIVDESRSGIERQKQLKSFEIAQMRYGQAEKDVVDAETLREVEKVVADSKVQRLEMLVGQIQQDIEKLNVKASKSGIIMYIADHKGEKVAVGDTLWQGQRVLTIPSLDKIAIRAEFDEPDTSKVAVNSKVKVTLEAYPEMPFIGHITSLGQAYKPKSNQNPKVVFEAFISLDEVDSSLMRPGMKARVELLAQSNDKESKAHG